MAAEESQLRQDFLPGSPTNPAYVSRKKLDTLAKVRAEQASIYRKVKAGTMDPSQGSKLTWMLGQLRQTLEVQEKLRLAEYGAGGPDGPADAPLALPATARLVTELVRTGAPQRPETAGED